MPSDQIVEDRPRRLHPLSLLFGIAVLVRRFLVPALLFLVFARGEDWQRWMLLPFAFLLGAELIRYLTLTYRLTSEGELVIRSGLFSRTERHIPFERVQNVELVESAVHRVLGVAEVRLQTGGGAEVEAHLRVVSRDAVEELRRAILSTKRVEDAAAPPSTVLLRLPLSEVALHGLLTGRGLVLLAAMVGILFEYNIDWEPFVERFVPAGPQQWQVIWDDAFERSTRALFLWTLVFVPAVAGLRLLSAAWAVVRLYDFTLARTGEDLQSRYGLLTRVSATIPRARIQVLSVHEGVLHRWVRRASVRVDTAGEFKRESGRLGSQWVAPIVRADAVLPLVREVQPDAEIDPAGWTPVHRRAFVRVSRLQLLWTSVGTLVVGATIGPLVLVPALLVAGLAVWHARKLTARLAVALTPSSLVLRSGAFGHRRSIARFSRIQSVSCARSPFDRRWGMARISVDTAGGSPLHRIEMPYLDEAAAREIYRRLRAEVASAVRGAEPSPVRDSSGSGREAASDERGDGRNTVLHAPAPHLRKLPRVAIMRPLPEELHYRRSLFRTRLVGDRLYTASHFWIQEQEPGLWRIGVTKFASRMLGDVVEVGWDVAEGATVAVGDGIGWFEGFKARSDLYCVASGTFAGSNPELVDRIALIDDDRYGRGWLYAVRGTPDPGALDVHGYAAVLDETIDRMRNQPLG